MQEGLNSSSDKNQSVEEHNGELEGSMSMLRILKEEVYAFLVNNKDKASGEVLNTLLVESNMSLDLRRELMQLGTLYGAAKNSLNMSSQGMPDQEKAVREYIDELVIKLSNQLAKVKEDFEIVPVGK